MLNLPKETQKEISRLWLRRNRLQQQYRNLRMAEVVSRADYEQHLNDTRPGVELPTGVTVPAGTVFRKYSSSQFESQYQIWLREQDPKSYLYPRQVLEQIQVIDGQINDLKQSLVVDTSAS